MNDMKLKLGKSYKTRNGKIVRITYVMRNYSIAFGGVDGSERIYRLDGRTLHEDYEMDLVEEV